MLRETAPCTLNISHSLFTRNFAEIHGGAALIMADSLHVALDNTTFTNNSAQVTTGGVSLAPSATSSELLSLLAVNVTFTSKSAGQSGGLCANASDVRLIDCVSENNTATGDSAEGFNAHWIKFLLLDGCSFNYNQAGVQKSVVAVC
ncbi:TPA: hypothetical protein ACH3X1_015128 [Trebouxia sp. C0004]